MIKKKGKRKRGKSLQERVVHRPEMRVFVGSWRGCRDERGSWRCCRKWSTSFDPLRQGALPPTFASSPSQPNGGFRVRKDPKRKRKRKLVLVLC